MSCQCKHLAHLTVEEVLPKIGGHLRRATFVVDGEEYSVKANSTRLNLFKRKRVCVECGREGNIFCIDVQKDRLQKKKKRKRTELPVPHLNLYCHKPEEGDVYVLMTKDHTIPDKMGGLNIRQNMHCMCTHCNAKKAGRLRNVDIRRMISSKKGRKFMKRTWKKATDEQRAKWEISCE